MALTSDGLASAIKKPGGPACEWVMSTAGPIRSRSAAPAD